MCSYYLCHSLSLSLSLCLVVLWLFAPGSVLKQRHRVRAASMFYSVMAKDKGLPLTRLFVSHSSPCLHASNSTLPLSLPTSLLSFPSPTRMDSEGKEGGVGHSGTMWLPALSNRAQSTEASSVSMVGPPDAQPGSCLRWSFCHHWQP